MAKDGHTAGAPPRPRTLVEALARHRQELLEALGRGDLAAAAALLETSDAGARTSPAGEELDPRLREIVDHAPAAVFVKGSDGRYVFANRWVADLLGVAPRDLVGRTVADVLPEQVARRTVERERRAASAGELLSEDAIPTPHGERVLMTVRFPFRLRSGDLGTFGIGLDVTDRKRAQAEAEHARELLDLGDALVEVDRDWRIVRVNANQERLSRTPRSAALGRVLWEVWPEAADPQSRYWREYHRCMDGRVPVAFDERYAPLDMWTGVTAYPTRAGGLVAFFRDVSDRVRTAERLRAALDRLTAHVTTTPLAVVEWDSEYRVASFSARAEQLFGWSAAEVIGKRIDEIPWIPEEDWPAVRAVMRDMESGARPTNVNANRNLRKDGSTLYCEWYNSALRGPGGELLSVLSLVLDVTERRRAQASAELLARFPRENPDPVVRLGPDLTVAYANDAARALLGPGLAPGAAAPPLLAGSAREALSDRRRVRTEVPWNGRFLSLHFVPVRGEVNVYGQDVTARRRSEDALHASEARARAISGNIRDLLVVLEAVRTASGGLAGWRYVEANDGALALLGASRERVVGRTLREVLPTVNPQLEERLSRVHASGSPEQYEVVYGDRALLVKLFRIDADTVGSAAVDISDRRRAEEALRVANAQLVEADRRKDEFLGMLSHELRNPLAPIRNSIYVLGRAAPGSEQAERATAVIRRQTDHLARLVDDLLDVTRIARGKIDLDRERADLAAVVRRAAEDHRSVVSERGVSLVVEAPDAPLWATVDPTRIAQVVGNLLHNAAKFTAAGGKVTVAVEAAGDAGELRVIDTGVGMDPELLSRVFEPFVQGDRSLARTGGGLGLGLALVKGLVELHGGTVWAASEGAGRGTAVTVRLPLGGVTAPATGDGHPRAAARHLHVLVVDDNRDAAESLADLLRLLGHRVEVAFEGAAALAKARAAPPDVVLCDIGLPEMSGYDVARAVRSDPALRGVRLVAVSGYAQPEDLARALDAGFDGHVAKPPDAGEIERALGA